MKRYDVGFRIEQDLVKKFGFDHDVATTAFNGYVAERIANGSLVYWEYH